MKAALLLIVTLPNAGPAHVVVGFGGLLEERQAPSSGGAVVHLARGLDDIVSRAAKTGACCVVLDAGDLPDVAAAVRSIRERVGGASVVAVVSDAAAAPEGVDALIRPGTAAAGEIVRLIRFATGQPLREATRVPYGGVVEIERPAAPLVRATAIDLSEGGLFLRLCPGAELGDEPARLRFELEGTSRVDAEAAPARRTSCAEGGAGIAFTFRGPPAETLRALRAYVLRKQGGAGRNGSRPALAPVPASGSTAGAPVSLVPPAVASASPGGPSDLASCLLGASAALQRARDVLGRVAATDVTLLVVGDVGTGKELCARLLHERSRRAEGPFVVLGCEGLTEAQIEQAMRGATGAPGAAQPGTLYLEEVADLAVAVQARLLALTTERNGAGERGIAPRIVAATAHDLPSAIVRRKFRRDLYDRLNVVSLKLPRLAERPGDIPTLAEHFLARAQAEMGKQGIRLDAAAAETLLRYAWPGNVRELEQVCTRVTALAASGEEVGPAELGVLVTEGLERAPLPASDLHDILDFCEREILRRVLERNQGNRTRTARDLGISRQALQHRLARLHKGGKRETG